MPDSSDSRRPPIFRSFALFALIAAGPFLVFVSENLHEGLAAADLIPYWLGVALAAWLFYLLLVGLFWGRTARCAGITAVLLVGVLAYNDVRIFFAERGFDIADQRLGWLALLLVATSFSMRWGDRRAFRQFLWIFALLQLLPPAWQVARYWGALPVQGPALALEEAYPLAGNSIWSGVALRDPNIYWIVADSYSNGAELDRHFGFDNHAFIEALEQRGFYVAREAHSNFSNTRLSVPTMMNMEYPFVSGETYAVPIGNGWAPKPGRTNRGTVATVVGDNRSVGFLRQLGYRYIHFEGRTFNLLRCRGYEDLCIHSDGSGFSELEVSLMQRVPIDLYLEWVLDRPEGSMPKRDHHASGTGIPELGEAIASLPLPEPFFLYAHLSVPHPPFLVDEDCKPGALRASMASYVRQLRCVNRQLLELVDQIRRDDPAAIILLGGDHGPRMTIRPGTPLYLWDSAQVRESLGILNALLLPAECRRGLYPGLTPVNDMRIVFACLGGHDPVLIEPKHFVVRGGPPDGGKIRWVTLD
ncbi:MAG: sulfatase-like hydrolase/transferase [Myxococcota bacterium]|jgi:hypothetical protein